MLEHLGVHAQNYNCADSENQEPNFDHFVPLPGEKVTHPGRLRLKTGAANEIRITWSEKRPIGVQAKKLVAEFLAQERAEPLLVYSDKVQPLATEPAGPRTRKKTLGLTTNAKTTIREGASVMNDEYSKQVAFITLTLPGSTPEALRTIAEHATGILNAFNEQLRKHFKRSGLLNELAFDATGVWEPQKRGALHLHIIVGVPDKNLYKVIKAEHRRWWRQILEHYSDKTGVDLFAKADGGTWRGVEWMPKTECEKAKKDVGAYLSKYISKLSQTTLHEDGLNPARWWFMSKSLFEKVRNERREEELPRQGIEDAEKDGHSVALIGLHEAATHYKMHNPFTGKQCGYVLYFNRDEKDDIWVKMTEYLELQSGKLAPDPDEITWDEIMEKFDNADPSLGVYVSPDLQKKLDEASGAALCAPFSSQEKGGGMRYH